VGLVGDALRGVKLPDEEWACGGLACTAGARHLKDQDLILDGPEVLGEILEDDAEGCELLYLIVGLSSRTYLSARRRRGRADAVARGFDASVRDLASQLIARLPGWRVMVVRPAACTAWVGGPWEAARHVHRWTSWRGLSADFGGRGGSFVVDSRGLHAFNGRGLTKPLRGEPPSRSASALADSSGAQPDGAWHTVAAVFVRRALAADVLATCPVDVERVLNDVEFQLEGRVRRHARRGATALSPKELRRREDAAALGGMRNAADLYQSWPKLWDAMAVVGRVLRDARARHAELRGLHECFGGGSARPEPSADLVARVRAEVAASLGLEPGTAEATHSCSPWRFNLVDHVQQASGDPDSYLVPWLRDGAPMGIRSPIESSGGIFPAFEVRATRTPESVLAEPRVPNHPSFGERAGQSRPPGHVAIEAHVNEGFGYLFEDQAAAERHLGTRVTAAPLGTITKERGDGSLKHRVIMDLRANGVNDAVTLPERQVLPTVYDHARDMTVLSAGLGADEMVRCMVLDIRDAFMGVPLSAAELPFNCCAADLDIVRNRPEKFPGEASVGRFVIWGVLGFGGRPNPLVFARAVSFATRSAQGLLRPRAGAARGSQTAAPGRLQTYVDDPVLTVAGSAAACSEAVDLVITWWRVLGLPLAWSKGVYTEADHTWIGGRFRLVADPVPHAVVQVPEAFADELYVGLEPFARPTGTLGRAQVDQVLGRVGRLAYIVPAVRPYLAALWAAACSSDRTRRDGRADAPPGRYPAKRFAVAAAWLRTLLRPPAELTAGLFPLEQHVVEARPAPTEHAPAALVDASPWGGGGALRLADGSFTEYFEVGWSAELAGHLCAVVGDPASQTTFEYVVVLLALVLWASEWRTTGLHVLGDNLGALEGALNLRGRSDLSKVTRELTWRQVRGAWLYDVGHLPSEANVVADALSRLRAPPNADRKAFPDALAAARRREVSPESLWTCT
jgi:hypothetical protein